MYFFFKGGCIVQYSDLRFNILTLMINTFDQELFSLIQVVIMGREHKCCDPLSSTFLTPQKGRLRLFRLLLSVLLPIFIKCVRPTGWKWEIKCSECAVLIWVFRGIRVPIRPDQGWRSVSLLHGSGCWGTECWLLAEIGEAASPCLDQTFLLGWLNDEGP